MIFTQRYHRALQAGRLAVELDETVRRKLWSQLEKHNIDVGVQRDPNDRWIDNSSALEEAQQDLETEHGWDPTPNPPRQDGGMSSYGGLKRLLMTAEAPVVFDIVELVDRYLEVNGRAALRIKLNEIFNLAGCPWRFTDGEFFKLDADFIGAGLVEQAHGALAAHSFEGAAQEFAQARQDAGIGDSKDAILYAGKSFESVLKVVAGVDRGSADKLSKALTAQGLLDDLPEGFRAGFGDQVLKALPFLRNNLAGHGQGATVIDIPQAYADLAVQLAAAFNNFLIAKHLERLPPPPDAVREVATLDDEIPF